MKLDGRIKGINTKSKAEIEGLVLHTTRVTVDFYDVDRPTLDLLAMAEHRGKLVTLEVESNAPNEEPRDRPRLTMRRDNP